MWYLESISFRNLFSYDADEDYSLSFKTGDVTYVVCGVNNDETGADSNGSGKSSLLDIIGWVLFGCVPRCTDPRRVINRTCIDAYGWGQVILCNIEKTCTIVVCRKRGRTEDVDKRVKELSFDIIEKDGTAIDKTCRTMTDTQRAISSCFGYSNVNHAWPDFVSKVYFSSSSANGFLSPEISPMDRQQILERYLNLGVLDRASALAKAEQKTLNSNVDSLRGQHSILSEQLCSIQKELGCDATKLQIMIMDRKQLLHNANETMKLLTQQQQNLFVLYTSYTTLLTTVSTQEMRLKQVKANISALKSDFEKASACLSEYQDCKLKLQTLREKYGDCEARIEELTTDRDSAARSMSEKERTTASVLSSRNAIAVKQSMYYKQKSNHLLCPVCNSALMVIGDNIKCCDLAAIDAEIESCGKAIYAMDERIGVINTEIADHCEYLNTLDTELVLLRRQVYEVEALATYIAGLESSGILDLKNDLNHKKSELRNTYNVAKGDYEAALYKRSAFIMQHEDVDFDNFSQTLNVVQFKKSALEQEIRDGTAEIIGMESKAKELSRAEKQLLCIAKDLEQALKANEVCQYWTDEFLNIKVELLNQAIPQLEAGINNYLNLFGVSKQVELRLYQENKAGDVRRGFNIQVFDGSSWDDIAMFSSGERTRILIACGYALRDLSVSTQPNSFGFIMVDEILDNIDATGIDKFFELSRGFSGQRFVITHTKPEDVMVWADDAVIVTKTDGTSHCEVKYVASDC